MRSAFALESDSFAQCEGMSSACRLYKHSLWFLKEKALQLIRLVVRGSHAIVSSSVGPEYYVSIMSFVDKAQLEPGCTILLHNKARLASDLLFVATCDADNRPSYRWCTTMVAGEVSQIPCMPGRRYCRLT